MSAPDPLWTAEKVAEWLSVPKLRVYELVRVGHLPAVRLGRQIRFDPAKIRAFIEAGGTNGNGAE